LQSWKLGPSIISRVRREAADHRHTDGQVSPRQWQTFRASTGGRHGKSATAIQGNRFFISTSPATKPRRCTGYEITRPQAHMLRLILHFQIRTPEIFSRERIHYLILSLADNRVAKASPPLHPQSPGVRPSPFRFDVASLAPQTRYGVWMVQCEINPMVTSKKKRTIGEPAYQYFKEVEGRFSRFLKEALEYGGATTPQVEYVGLHNRATGNDLDSGKESRYLEKSRFEFFNRIGRY
jgi:hypothetical protein